MVVDPVRMEQYNFSEFFIGRRIQSILSMLEGSVTILGLLDYMKISFISYTFILNPVIPHNLKIIDWNQMKSHGCRNKFRIGVV